MPPALPIATPSPLKAVSYSPPLSPRAPHPVQSASKAAGKGVFGGLSCLECLLGDLGFGTRTASLLEEKKGGGREGRGGKRGGRGGRAEVPT